MHAPGFPTIRDRMQAVGDHTIHFSSLELPGLSATRYTVTCSSRPLVYLSPRTDLTGLSTPLAEHCADVLNALPAVTLGRESSLDAGAVAAIIAAIVGVHCLAHCDSAP